MRKFEAYTFRADTRLDEIITKVAMSARPIFGYPLPPIIPLLAFWDSGATFSAVTQRTVETMGLQHYDHIDISHATGWSRLKRYSVRIFITPTMYFELLAVGLLGDDSDFGLVIGMDIIKRGDLSVTQVDGKTVLSYRTPSIETIDYVEELEALKRAGKVK